jgi:hypothetical protein
VELSSKDLSKSPNMLLMIKLENDVFDVEASIALDSQYLGR